MTKRIILASLLCLTFSACLQAKEIGLIDKNTAIEAAKTATVEKYPDSDEVLVSGYTKTKYNADGTSIDIMDYYTKVLTEAGKRNNLTLTFNYTLPYNTVEVQLVEIIKPDGSSTAIDIAQNSKEMTDNSSMSMNIYNPNDKKIIVSVPGLEIGDMLHYIAVDNNVKTRMADTWCNYIVFESTCPILNEVYEVYAPNELPIKSKAIKDELPGTIAYEAKDYDGGIVHRWTATNVPRFFPEPKMPDSWTCVQRLLVSTISDWPTVSRWYWDLSKPHYESTDAMKEKVAELTKDLTTEEEKIRAIFKFVSQEIRYMGISIEKDAPGYEPHDVNLTFENKHGVCRDKAGLLVVMLRLADIEAYPVLIHSGPKKDIEVPLPYFNHAITCVRNEDGTYQLMDSTDESTQRLCPSYLGNCSYLVAAPYGETLLTSPVDPAETNMLEIATDAKIDARGNYSAKSIMDFQGINDNVYRGAFLRRKPEEIRTFLEGVLKRFLPGGKLDSYSITPTDFQDTSENIKAVMEYHCDNILVSGEKMSLLPIYAIGREIGMANFVLRDTGLDKRRFTLETGITCGVLEKITLDIDSSLEAYSIPEKALIEEPYLTLQSNISKSDDGVVIEKVLKFNQVEFTPEEYLNLKENLKDIEYNSRKQIVLNKTTDAGNDSILLSKKIEYNVVDEHNWTTTTTVKRKILTYKGKKDNSELKFTYVPAWEELTLNYARVINGENVKEISDVEKNVMDAGWVASAPRYPEGKILVASLPGVENNSIIEYSYTTKSKDEPFFSFYRTFQSSEPLEQAEVVLNIPSDIEIKTIYDGNGIFNEGIGDEIDYSMSKAMNFSWTAKEVTTYKWVAKNLPALKSEDAMPPYYTFTPFVKSTTGEIGDFSSEVGKFAEKAMATKEKDVEKMAKELVASCKTKEDKIVAIRDFVAKNIRNAGPSFTSIPLSSHSACATTLTERYGNSLDRAILTAKLLKFAGIKNEIVLVAACGRIASIEDFQLSTISPSLWSTVLVKAIDGKREFYLGDTNQYDNLGTTNSDRYLGVDIKTGKISRINIDEQNRDKSDSTISIKIDRNGDANMTVSSNIWGNAYGSSNGYFSESTPENRKKFNENIRFGNRIFRLSR